MTSSIKHWIRLDLTNMLGSVPASNARSKKKSNCLVPFQPTAAQKCSLSVSCGAAAFSKLQGFRVNGISQSQTSPATSN